MANGLRQVCVVELTALYRSLAFRMAAPARAKRCTIGSSSGEAPVSPKLANDPRAFNAAGARRSALVQCDGRPWDGWQRGDVTGG